MSESSGRSDRKHQHHPADKTHDLFHRAAVRELLDDAYQYRAGCHA
ncbi:MAG: hypothetical protein ACLRSD_01540 [Oscillibacter sp.]